MFFYSKQDIPQPPKDPNIVMYSLTTCSYCEEKAKELAKHNIAHVEYFIDKDKERDTEMWLSIRRVGLKIETVGTPTFVIYNEVLPNNPSIEAIKATIAKHRKNEIRQLGHWYSKA